MAPGIVPPREEDEAAAETSSQQSVTFVLEGATLETAKVGKGYELLNCDDHTSFLKRHGRDPAQYRPDIAHQALLMILDSPLNKAGKVKEIYVHTAKNVLIQVNPKLLQKLSIRATNGPDKLLRVVKGPVPPHLPVDALRIGFSHSSESLAPVATTVARFPPGKPLVFVLGAFSHGKIDDGYVDEYLSISQFPLSAAYAIARLTNALEAAWDLV
uniref:Ribosomal RNA small subunit methyltransferase NEP1 n=1 Tax=Auxenochlorella protothecoides TaxID=3075 RepID=A0A1D1ZTI4_AUXPR